MPSNSVSINFIARACVLLTMAFTSTVVAQNSNSTESDVSNAGAIVVELDESTSGQPGIRLSKPIEVIWDFGLKVQAAGQARNVNASFPYPMSFPEQSVEIIEEEKTGNVSRIRKSNPTKFAQKMSFSVSRVVGGQPQAALLRLKINKRMIIAPEDTSIFVIPKKPPTAIKTFLKPSPYIESTHKRVREIANELRDETLTAWDQAELNYKWVRDNIKYQFDRQIHTCLDALDRKQGDCEELSSLFIAICRAQKIPARAVWIPGHTYPEFYLEDGDGNGHWFPCQAAGTYQFGSMSELRPILHKGDRFRIPGERKDVRYLQATATASGQIAIEAISRQVQKPNASPQ